MESSVLTAVLLPLALFVIMLGMGLGLTVADFKRVVVEPRAMVLGLVAQLVMLPLVGLGLAIARRFVERMGGTLFPCRQSWRWG